MKKSWLRYALIAIAIAAGIILFNTTEDKKRHTFLETMQKSKNREYCMP